jgi:hypothetical protein
VVVVGGAALEIERALLHLEHADVRVVGPPIVVVLVVARLGALAAADAHAEVQRVPERHAFLRRDVLDLDVDAVHFFRLGLEAAQDLRKLLRRQFLVMLAQHLVQRKSCAPLHDRLAGVGERAGAQRGSHDLQGDATIRSGHQ